MEPRREEFFDNTPGSGSGQGQGQGHPTPFYPDTPLSNFPHTVVAVRGNQRSSGRDTNIYSGGSHLCTASSINRTATSGLPYINMPPKRPSSASPSINTGTVVKVPKTEQKPEDFSNSVKKRLQSSTRTGQACDRCKVRKIRCDGLPGGCSPCLQNQTECRTTDRITGRAAPRGYVESIELQNREMAARIRELEQLLMQNGIDIKPSNNYTDHSLQSYNYNPAGQGGSTQMWSPATPSSAYPAVVPTSSLSAAQEETNLFRALPAFRAGCMGDNYLGVSSGNSHLSSIKGTALSILGMEIDIADFTSLDMDEPDSSVFHPQLYNKSYQAFLQSSLNINPRIEKVDLPSREEGLTYAQWFFRVINPYLPVLHKGSFMSLLTRFYDDPSFRPTAAQTVCVHMVFAIMFFQYAVRNYEDQVQQSNLNHQSNMHYHYSLGMYYQLIGSHTVQDVQALTLICVHLRNFPKPGASWILTMVTISLAIELGMHRSVKRWASELAPNPLEVELRKRTFWSILTIHVSLSGKLGRPMVLRAEDFDVEVPEAVDDDLISEAGFDTSRTGRCAHSIGLAAWRIEPLYMELYSTIYAVQRNPETYIQTVNNLEAKLRVWTDSLPPELVKGESGPSHEEGRVFALYLQLWALEFKLLLRHPAVSLTVDPNFNAESMKICVESARQMLGVVKQIQKFKSLDTTWYQTAVYVMAVNTTLFSAWEKRKEITAIELADLRVEMDSWLDVMGEIGLLLGSGTRLREAVRVVTDGTLGLLSRSLQSNPVYINQGTNGQDIKPSHRRKASTNTNGFSGYSQSFTNTNGGTGGSTAYPHSDNQLTHTQTPYPAATQYSSYPDPTVNTTLSYTPQDSNAYSNYPSSNSDPVEAPLLAAFAAQASQVAPNWTRPASSQSHNPVINSSSQSWQQWTSTMAGNLEPQDRYSATALMQLGGRDLSVPDVGGPSASLPDLGAQTSIGQDVSGSISGVSSGMAWPLNIFDINHSGNGS